MPDAAPPSPQPLEYGRERRRRWVWRPWMTTAVIIVVTIGAAWFGWTRLDLYLTERSHYATTVAWYHAARTCVIPAGTVLYSERADEVAKSPRYSSRGAVRFATFDDQWPQLRLICYQAYQSGSVPVLYPYGVLFVHERSVWDYQGGTKPAVVCVSYNGLARDGKPMFAAMTYRMTAPGDKLRFGFFGSSRSTKNLPGRSLANLRIFAGTADPVDLSRFTLPFDCDGGHGRFEFQTDTDVTDGGDFAPEVWIEWDDAASSTQPTTSPSSPAKPGV